MKRFLIKCGITILAFLGSMVFVFLFINPIFNLLFDVEYLGYWSHILFPISLSFASSLICLIIVYVTKKKDEYCN